VSAKPAVSNEAVLRFSGTELVGPVLERVVGMLVARADAPIDRLDDAMLLSDAIAAHAQEFTNGSSTSITVATSPKELALRVAPLSAKDAKKFVASSDLPEVGNVIERLTTDIRHDGDTLSMTLAFGH
jgi:hypothetical protein